MKYHAWSIALGLALGLGVSGTSKAAVVVPNGDFETDANNFTAFPGYVGTAGNPSGVTDFTGPSSGYGINPGNGAGTPFRDNGADTTNVLFIQSGGTTLTSSSITGLTAGTPYLLTFDYNARNCCGGTPAINVTVNDGEAVAPSFSDPLDTPVGGTNPLHVGTVAFVPTSSSATISIAKTDGVAGDSTATFDNFVITQTPEPTAVGVIALAGIALVRRRR